MMKSYRRSLIAILLAMSSPVILSFQTQVGDTVLSTEIEPHRRVRLAEYAFDAPWIAANRDSGERTFERCFLLGAASASHQRQVAGKCFSERGTNPRSGSIAPAITTFLQGDRFASTDIRSAHKPNQKDRSMIQMPTEF
jgi:hypothetical protein